MSSRSHRSVIPGVILILAGIFLLLEKLNVFHLTWNLFYPGVILAIGILFAVRIFTDKNRKLVFPATFFILFGLFLGLQNVTDIWWLYWEESWPIVLIILGLSFLAQYLVQLQNTSLLVLSLVILIFGVSFFVRNLGFYLPYRYRWWLQHYWPLLLILLGLLLVWAGVKGKEESLPDKNTGEGEQGE